MSKIFKNKKENKKVGFTIMEVLIVIAIVGILAVIVLASFGDMRDRQLLKATASDIFSALDKARSQTLASVNSSEYGVHFQSDKIVIFKGTIYSSSDSNNEEILFTSGAFISSINLTSGAVDLYFNRLSGAPNKSGTITVSVSSLSKTVTISPTGASSMD
ncbi:prepilin-type N-terminal cleavage/methylation domain-containing protein [Candidatus Nomurabacteria bacterium]|nr:prepilin-type N-terminal cleavage/methylation domain-containing protein [Candidatus Nomurabacteria bacterium]